MTLSEHSARVKDLRTAKAARVQLQHRHYAFIASCLRDIPSLHYRAEACRVFCHALNSNDNFDESRFRDAVGRIGEIDTGELELQIATTALWLDAMQHELLHRKGHK